MGNKGLSEKLESKLEHIEKYRNIHIFPGELENFRNRVIPELIKRKVRLKEISISRIDTKKESLDFIFNNEKDEGFFSELESLTLTYVDGEFIKFPPTQINVKRMTFVGCRLKNDDLLKKCEDVENLDIRGNFFDQFPSTILRFKKTLTRLNMMGLLLEELPEIEEFTNLVYLKISENLITELTGLSKLQKLETLLCYDNRIEKFSEALPRNMIFIDASKNRIKKIPESFPLNMKEIYFHYNLIEKIDVSSLESLERLGFSNNKVSDCNVTNCPLLTIFDGSNNQMSSITGLSTCVSLQELSIPLNNFTDQIFEAIPKSSNKIFKLLLGYNQIEKIPQNFFEGQKRIVYFDVSGNTQISEIPNSIVNLGENINRLYFLLGDLPNLKIFPKERIDIKIVYFFAWGSPLESSLLKILENEAPDNSFRTDFSEVQEKEEEEEEEKKKDDNIKTCHCSIKGPFRPQNEDAYIDCVVGVDGRYHLIAVLDGHGGTKASNVAAEILPKYLNDIIEKEKDDIIDDVKLTKIFNESIEKTNEHLKSENVEDGTTFVSILVDSKQDFFIVANLGDSRAIAYSKDDNNNQHLIDLTRDHKPTDPIEFKWMNDSGIHVLVNSKVDGKIGVSRSLGDFRFELNAVPEFRTVLKYSENVSYVVLACDGVFDVFSSFEVLGFVQKMREDGVGRDIMAKRLVNLALSNGSRDNISAVIVEFSQYHKQDEDPEEVEGEDN